MAFIRKRISPTSRRTPSYQLVESYRENGKVRQRVLANLGPWPTLDEALEHASIGLGRAHEFVRMCERGHNNAGRSLGEQDGEHARRRLEKAQAKVEKLERVVSEKRRMVPVSDTTAPTAAASR